MSLVFFYYCLGRHDGVLMIMWKRTMVDSVYYLSYDGLDGPSRELLVSFYFLSVGCFLRVYISVLGGNRQWYWL